MGAAVKLDWLRGAPIAHRGLYSPRRPENSLAAVEHAIASGFGVEVDVRVSADGIPVVHHDATLLRMSGLRRRVRQCSAAHLIKTRLGRTDQTIPTLGDVLRLVAGQVPLVVDVKCGLQPAERGAIVHAVTAAATRYQGPIAIVTFDALLLRAIRDRLPTMARGQTVGIARTSAIQVLLSAAVTHPLDLGWLKRPSVPEFLSVNVACLARPEFQRLRRAGLPVLGWTIRTAAQLDRARSLADNLIVEGHAADILLAHSQMSRAVS